MVKKVYINQRKAGVILSYAGQFAKILISIIYTPIMLRLLGQSEYGLYQLVYSVVSYLSLLSLGFSSSYMRFYSRYKAQKDEDGVARLNGMFLLIFASLSVVCILCGCVMLSIWQSQLPMYLLAFRLLKLWDRLVQRLEPQFL